MTRVRVGRADPMRRPRETRPYSLGPLSPSSSLSPPSSLSPCGRGSG